MKKIMDKFSMIWYNHREFFYNKCVRKKEA